MDMNVHAADAAANVAADTKEEPTTRERKKMLTRHALHDAALRLSIRNGYANVTVKDICSDAGVSARTFFNYYPSKASAVIGIIFVNATVERRRRFIEDDGDLMSALCDLISDCVIVMPRETGFRQIAKDQHDAFFALGLQMRETRKAITSLVEQRAGNKHTADLAIELALAALKMCLRHKIPSTSKELSTALKRTISNFALLTHSWLPAESELRPASESQFQSNR